MAQNQTKPTTLSVAAFLDGCTDESRRKDAKVLAMLMRKVTGKGSLYIKRLADVDMKVLEILVKKAVSATRARHITQA